MHEHSPTEKQPYCDIGAVQSRYQSSTFRLANITFVCNSLARQIWNQNLICARLFLIEDHEFLNRANSTINNYMNILSLTRWRGTLCAPETDRGSWESFLASVMGCFGVGTG